MNNSYSFKKYMMPKEKVIFIYITFNNGAYISLSKSEIVSYDFKFYDELVWDNDCFVKKACCGQIRLKIKNHSKLRDNQFIDQKAKNFSRKKNFEKMCLEGYSIKSIVFFNDNYWNETVLGNFSSKIENDVLTITANEDPQKHSSSSEDFHIRLSNPSIDDIRQMRIVMENCESFCVYGDEIKELKLKLSDKLDAGEGLDFNRQIIGGYMKIKFASIHKK